MNNYSKNRHNSELTKIQYKQMKTLLLKFNHCLALSFLWHSLSKPTGQDDGSHGHEAMEVNGCIKRDVCVEEGFSAQRDEVATDSEEHVGKQKGDSGC